MKPSKIFKDREIWDTTKENLYNQIKNKHSVVLYIDSENGEFLLLKYERDNYLWVYSVSKDMGGICVNYRTEANYNIKGIKFKDKKLYEEFRDRIILEAI